VGRCDGRRVGGTNAGRPRHTSADQSPRLSAWLSARRARTPTARHTWAEPSGGLSAWRARTPAVRAAPRPTRAPPERRA